MAHFSHHTTCPKCRELGKDKNGNNLGVYSDGSAYCFSCGYYKFGSVIPQTTKNLHTSSKQPTRTISLPGDCDPNLPEKAWNFLGQFALTELDAIKNNLLWSEEQQRLCFPIFDNNKNLLAWQGRYLGEREHAAKWISYGNLSELLHILGPTTTERVVLVEDIISAIRISNCGIPCIPIFGSHISTTKLRRIKALGFVNIFIWLDKDKQVDALTFTNTARQMGLNGRTIITDRDPKTYSKQDILNILT